MTLLPQEYLRTLPSIRERCTKVYEKAKQGESTSFDINEAALSNIVNHVVSTTTRRFPELRQRWTRDNVDRVEQARRLIDLVLVSVLVDAGAGQVWKYTTREGERVGRSEGLALASFDMFLNGYFSSSADVPDRVDG